jgi:SAM-dependent methyltransferase
LLPLGTVELDGRTLPAPAEPERLLEAMYGPHWREPDPAFQFETPDETIRRLDAWFRGTRVNRNHWDRRYSDARESGPIRRPHELARLVHRVEMPGSTVVDLGCGRGQDAVWLAARGHPTIGLDYADAGYAHLKRRAAEEGWPVDFEAMNLLELRHAMAWGARLARLAGPRVLMARHLIDATSPRGRQNLWRLSAMALAGGGRLYVEFVTGDGDGSLDDSLLHPLDPDEVAAEVAEFGGRVMVVDDIQSEWTGQPSNNGGGGESRSGCRMVMGWSR